jgi:hypothetical protein
VDARCPPRRRSRHAASTNRSSPLASPPPREPFGQTSKQANVAKCAAVLCHGRLTSPADINRSGQGQTSTDQPGRLASRNGQPWTVVPMPGTPYKRGVAGSNPAVPTQTDQLDRSADRRPRFGRTRTGACLPFLMERRRPVRIRSYTVDRPMPNARATSSTRRHRRRFGMRGVKSSLPSKGSRSLTANCPHERAARSVRWAWSFSSR